MDRSNLFTFLEIPRDARVEILVDNAFSRSSRVFLQANHDMTRSNRNRSSPPCRWQATPDMKDLPMKPSLPVRRQATVPLLSKSRGCDGLLKMPKRRGSLENDTGASLEKMVLVGRRTTIQNDIRSQSHPYMGDVRQATSLSLKKSSEVICSLLDSLDLECSDADSSVADLPLASLVGGRAA